MFRLSLSYYSHIYSVAYTSVKFLGQSECTSGFVSRDRVRDLSRVVGGRILSMINFTCSGSIIKWTVAADWNGGGMNVNFPQLEIWRIQSAGSNVYDRVRSTGTTATAENGSQIYEFFHHLHCSSNLEMFLEYSTLTSPDWASTYDWSSKLPQHCWNITIHWPIYHQWETSE